MFWPPSPINPVDNKEMLGYGRKWPIRLKQVLSFPRLSAFCLVIRAACCSILPCSETHIECLPSSIARSGPHTSSSRMSVVGFASPVNNNSPIIYYVENITTQRVKLASTSEIWSANSICKYNTDSIGDSLIMTGSQALALCIDTT